MDSQVHYLPLTPGFFSILIFLVAGLIILIQLRILRYAYMRLGVGPGAALVLLFGSLIGSYFNIPITVLPGPPVQSGEIVEFFGMRYVVPVVVSWPGTVLAVNVGGAVIPTIMSTYLVIRYQLWLKAAIANCGPWNFGALWDTLPELTRIAFVARSHSMSDHEGRQKANELCLDGVADKIECPLFVVAGGLDAGNVRRAIEQARPWGVDACSRIEISPGKKDHVRMTQFLKAALSS